MISREIITISVKKGGSKFLPYKFMEKDGVWGTQPQEYFRSFDKVMLTFFTKFGGVWTMNKNYGSLEGGAPQKNVEVYL